jgi:hypothetical protein
MIGAAPDRFPRAPADRDRARREGIVPKIADFVKNIMLKAKPQCGGSEIRFILAAGSSSGFPNQTTLEL